MHVYLKDDNQRRWIADVHLLNGYCPSIGGGLSAKTLSNVLRMEPAIWCKVLVLESVSVDCNRRMISWSTGNLVKEEDGTGSPNQYNVNDECSGYDADDELFDLARTIINKVSDDDYELCILRMLHCFILPKITLHREDLDKVLQARERQLQYIQALDNKVLRQCMILDEHQNESDQLREQFLPCLEQMICDNQCSNLFLDYLLVDVSKEECKLRCQMDTAQNVVDAAKLQVAGNSSPEADSQLHQAREDRNLIQCKLMLIVMARELVVEAQPEVADRLRVVGSPILQDYLEKRDALQKLKDDRNKLLEQKNCALSVREMLDGILTDLRNTGFAQADDADSQGIRATDVLQGVWYPEWQKLGERVATIVDNSEHPIGINFKSFCTKIRGMCQDLINLGQLDTNCVPGNNINVACHPFGKMNTEDSTSLNGSLDETYGLEDFVVDSYRDRLHELKREIFQHFELVTELLSETFSNRDVQFKHKIRLAYEQCFFESEHGFVECVYELAHRDHIVRLETDVKRIKKLPIKLLNLQMKDEWWLEIFEQRVRIGSLSEHVVRPGSSIENGHHEDADFDIGGSYDMIDELDDSFPVELDTTMKSFSDSVSIRSFFINTVRVRSRTYNFDESSSEDEDVGCVKVAPRPMSCVNLSSSAPHVSLMDVIDKWENKPNSVNMSLSKSHNDVSRTKSLRVDIPDSVVQDTFEDHFGPALQNIGDIFKATSPMAKLKCLTASLRKITSKVAELRLREGGDKFSTAVTAEDLLPLLILMMLQMEPCDAASMWPQLAMIEDLMAPFLASGCHGWALVEFQMAQRILSELCSQF